MYGSEDLEIAAKLGLTEVVRTLLDAGHRDESGYALRYAANNGHLECAQALLDTGHRDTGHRDASGYALYRAAGNGHLGCLKALLDAGHRDTEALYWAARNGHTKIVALLETYQKRECSMNTKQTLEAVRLGLSEAIEISAYYEQQLNRLGPTNPEVLARLEALKQLLKTSEYVKDSPKPEPVGGHVSTICPNCSKGNSVAASTVPAGDTEFFTEVSVATAQELNGRRVYCGDCGYCYELYSTLVIDSVALGAFTIDL